MLTTRKFLYIYFIIDAIIIFVYGRKYYVGGEFPTILNGENAIPTVVNNIAEWNGTQWNALGNGTDGEVRKIVPDTCNNLYIVGKFTHAGGILTGPIAFYNQTAGQWQSVGQQNLTWFAKSYVNDVAVDCSMDNSGICLTCDVWLGGNFIVYISGQSVAVSILHWDSVNSKWDPVSGNLDLVIGEVFAITKKNFGNSFASNNVWIAGSFSSVFARYNIGSKTWGFSSPLGGYFQGVIYSLYYKNELYYETDKIFLAGSFSFILSTTPVTTLVCVNICQFNYFSEQFVSVGLINSAPNAAVMTVTYGDSSLYIGGFMQNDQLSYSRMMNLPSISGQWQNCSINNNDYLYVILPVYGMFVCNSYEDCQPGSVLIVGKGGLLVYYNISYGTWGYWGSSNQVGNFLAATSISGSVANMFFISYGSLFILLSVITMILLY